jgi:hypothetical protein
MRWPSFILLVLAFGCTTVVTNPPVTPPTTAFDGLWTGDLDGDSIADCLTISGGRVTAFSANCSFGLLVVTSDVVQQVNSQINLVWTTQQSAAGGTLQLQRVLDGTLADDGSISGTHRALGFLNNIPVSDDTFAVTLVHTPAAGG